MHNKNIPVAMPDLSGNEGKYLLEAFRSSWISSSGAFINKFETEFATITDSKYAYGVCNGTVALHLALIALNVMPGDEVIVPSLTFIATANAIKYVGATPVFVDVDPLNWCIDPTLLDGARTEKTKGIIAVDLYGHPADYDALNKFAEKHSLWVIEDAAEAHGALYKGKPVGGLADIGTFSFFGNKILTSGEGGAVTTNCTDLAKKMLMIKGQGMDPQRRYFFPIIGHNFRITNLACAILCGQIERCDEIYSKRRSVFTRYKENLQDVKGVIQQPVSSWAVAAPWLYSILIDEAQYGHSRDELMQYLSKNGVDTRPFFIPIHSLPPYVEEAKARKTILPVTDKLASAGINLPTSNILKKQDIDFICTLIRNFAKAR